MFSLQYFNNSFEVKVLKEWKCVQVGHHDDVGPAIEEWERAGWLLHTYTTAGVSSYRNVNHYLLFSKGE